MDLNIPQWGASSRCSVSDRVTVIEGKLREVEKDHETLARVDERTQDLVAPKCNRTV